MLEASELGAIVSSHDVYHVGSQLGCDVISGLFEEVELKRSPNAFKRLVFGRIKSDCFLRRLGESLVNIRTVPK